MKCPRGQSFYPLVSLILGCAVNFNEGTMESFSVYSNAFKDQFNFTQKQVEFLSSMSVGLGLAFVPGLLYDRYGPKLTSLLGFLLTVPAFILLWSAPGSVEFYSNKFWLIGVYFFISGFGYEFTNLAALSTTLDNFDSKYAGKVSGIQYTSFWVGTSVYSWIFYTYFVSADFAGNQHADIPGLMLLFAVSVGVVDMACVFFLRGVETDEDVIKESEETFLQELTEIQKFVEGAVVCNKNGNDSEISDRSSSCRDSNVQRSFDNKEHLYSWLEQSDNQTSVKTLKELTLCMNYQLLVWMVALSRGVSAIYEFNIIVFTRSLRYEYINTILTTMIPIIRAVVTILIGIMSDHLLEKVSRLTIFIIGLIVSLCSQIGLVLFADTLWVFILSSITISMSLSVWAFIPPTIMRELFHPDQFGRNWSLCNMLGQMIGLASQQLFGALYDDQVGKTGQADCYGLHCVQWCLAGAIGLNGLSIALGLCIYVRLYSIRR